MSFLSRSLEFSHNCPHNKIEADLYLVSIYTQGKYDLVDIIIFRSLNNVQKVQLHFGHIISKGISKLTEILQ